MMVLHNQNQLKMQTNQLQSNYYKHNSGQRSLTFKLQNFMMGTALPCNAIKWTDEGEEKVGLGTTKYTARFPTGTFWFTAGKHYYIWHQ